MATKNTCGRRHECQDWNDSTSAISKIANSTQVLVGLAAQLGSGSADRALTLRIESEIERLARAVRELRAEPDDVEPKS